VVAPLGTLAVNDDIDEQPWHAMNRSKLWDHEQEIRAAVDRGYSARQIIRILKLTVRGRPASETWLRDWISRNGMRRGAVKKDTLAVPPQTSTATIPLHPQTAPPASPARADDHQPGSSRGSAPAALPPTAHELREKKAEKYVRDALNPLVQRAMKVVEESKK
jgi:hypothetical protein